MSRLLKIQFLIPIILGILLILQLTSAVVFFKDRQYLNHTFNEIINPASLPSDQAKYLVDFLKEKPSEENASYFLLPIFRVLRPTARQVLKYGGDCADRSRLLIRLMQLRGIQASKWALYSKDLQPKHAVVEIETEKGKMVVDPLFGLWFPRSGGGYYSIEELRRDPGILHKRIKDLRLDGEQPGTAQLKFYPLDTYIYDYARTINWNKSYVMQLLYRGLYLVMGDKVNNFRRPAWVEQPAIMAVIGLSIAEGGLLILWILAAKFPNRHKDLPLGRTATIDS